MGENPPNYYESNARPLTPINVEGFEKWIQSIRSRLILDEDLKNVLGKDIEKAIDMALSAVAPWMTDAGMIVMANDPVAFKTDVRRKIRGVAETIRAMVQGNLRNCVEVVDKLQGMLRESPSSISESVIHDKSVMEEIEVCIDSIRNVRRGVLAFMIAVDIILGGLNPNLPMSLMSNVVKGRSGFFTD